MRFGLAYVSYVYNYDREMMVKRSLASLARTNIDGLEKPVLRFTYKPTEFDYSSHFDALRKKFELEVHLDPPRLGSFDFILQDSATKLLGSHPDVTHVGFMCDDALCNSEWLQELLKLVKRRPDGIAWAVYRSGYKEFHHIVGKEGEDVLMSMHDGIGCVTREEWVSFVAKHGYVGAPDINHAAIRPGKRWATGRDYIDNLGRHPGMDGDWAIDFVGE